MKRAALFLLALLAACGPGASGRVDPARFQAFYLWAGVQPRPVLDKAATLYLLAGEVRRNGRYVPLRAVPHVPRADVWLVVRTRNAAWPDMVLPRLVEELDRWSAASNRVAGLQLDFDASTRGLAGYAAFLRQVRAGLPPRYRISATGLMDWSANADPSALAALNGTLDEVVVQSYQGRSTIPGYARYLERLSRVPVPHKVALVEGGEWREPAALRADPLFRGYVVFLVNPPQ